MLNHPLQITEVIDRQDASDFLRAIEITLSHMTLTQIEDVYLYVYRRKALAISFDAEWHAFFGYTRGYNQPEDRTPLRSGGKLLWFVRSELRSRPHDISGGRVFFSHDRINRTDRAYRVRIDLTEETLCRWIWLGDGQSVVDCVLYLLQNARFQ